MSDGPNFGAGRRWEHLLDVMGEFLLGSSEAVSAALDPGADDGQQLCAELTGRGDGRDGRLECSELLSDGGL